MDIAAGERVEGDLDAYITKADKRRRKEEGERHESRRAEKLGDRRGSVSDQTAFALGTLILVCFWLVVSADGMTAPPRRVQAPPWAWLVSFVVSCLVGAYSLWTLL